MNDTTISRKPLPRFFEFFLYAGFACGMALVVALVLRNSGPAVPPAQQPAIARSGAEATMLRASLGLQVSQPTVVEFMDFECPPCRATWPKLRTLLKQYPKVAYRPVNLPLQIHTFAFGAAVASEVARSKGQFDETFNDIFSGAVNLDVKSLNAYLGKHHLDPCVGTPRSKPFQDAVHKEQELAKEMKVNATPTMFVLLPDGSLTEVHSLDVMQKLLSST